MAVDNSAVDETVLHRESTVIEIGADQVCHFDLAIFREVNDFPDPFDEKLCSFSGELFLQQRTLRAKLLGLKNEPAPGRLQPDVVFAPYCRENVGLDEIRERQPKSFRVCGPNDGAELAADALVRISLPGKPGTQCR